MSTAVLLIHGRSQQTSRPRRRDQSFVAAHVEAQRRAWLAGLAKGLVLARRDPILPSQVYYPFYGNRFANLIDDHIRRGGRTPDLELVFDPDDPVVKAHDELILEAAAELGFRADRELAYDDPDLAEEVREASGEGDVEEELALGDALRVPIVRSALKFLSRKTGAAEWVIEEFLDDVAYYLEDDKIRDAVLDVVLTEVDRARSAHGDVAVVGHSLGSIVAYDLLQQMPADFPVRLLVTAGSPLGFPIVQRNLRGTRTGAQPAVPSITPRAGGAHWLNAYDVRDVVALVHPLRPRFADGSAKIRDEVTHNPSGAHDIADYLADPDVAGPIGDAVVP